MYRLRRHHRGRPAAVTVALLSALFALALPATAGQPEDAWQDQTLESGPVRHDALPHPASVHEWWYFTVQSPDAAGSCGPWQAMVTFLRDAEAGHDSLLFTAVVDGFAHDFTVEFPPGSLGYEFPGDPQESPPDAYEVTLGRSAAVGNRGIDGPARWSVKAQSGEATLDLELTEADPGLWHRRGPEGAGILEIVYAVRAEVAGSLTLEDGATVCDATGTGYFEHVWGDWSRLPMWGVDYLNAHLDGGWSVYARHTPMRGEGSFWRFLGQDPEGCWPPVLVITDGRAFFEAGEVHFDVTDTVFHDQLQVDVPAAYEVRARAFTSPQRTIDPPDEVVLTVGDVERATVFLETTSSGVLEGWGPAHLDLMTGDTTTTLTGTSEVETQRYGTTFPH